jgi:hypothetical protein
MPEHRCRGAESSTRRNHLDQALEWKHFPAASLKEVPLRHTRHDGQDIARLLLKIHQRLHYHYCS